MDSRFFLSRRPLRRALYVGAFAFLLIGAAPTAPRGPVLNAVETAPGVFEVPPNGKFQDAQSAIIAHKVRQRSQARGDSPEVTRSKIATTLNAVGIGMTQLAISGKDDIEAARDIATGLSVGGAVLGLACLNPASPVLCPMAIIAGTVGVAGSAFLNSDWFNGADVQAAVAPDGTTTFSGSGVPEFTYKSGGTRYEPSVVASKGNGGNTWYPVSEAELASWPVNTSRIGFEPAGVGAAPLSSLAREVVRVNFTVSSNLASYYLTDFNNTRVGYRDNVCLTPNGVTVGVSDPTCYTFHRAWDQPIADGVGLLVSQRLYSSPSSVPTREVVPVHQVGIPYWGAADNDAVKPYLAYPLSPEILASAADAAWQQAPDVEGAEAYDPSDPVTPQDVQAAGAENPVVTNVNYGDLYSNSGTTSAPVHLPTPGSTAQPTPVTSVDPRAEANASSEVNVNVDFGEPGSQTLPSELEIVNPFTPLESIADALPSFNFNIPPGECEAIIYPLEAFLGEDVSGTGHCIIMAETWDLMQIVMPILYTFCGLVWFMRA